ncbi:MAG: SDR family NAD(P)-dependent oxidoreductase [Hymenobacteraceae bacterium]|nr:SDR family NAD(P)-dependent oxidoreductase [Hymenobacteraceae bacterium]
MSTELSSSRLLLLGALAGVGALALTRWAVRTTTAPNFTYTDRTVLLTGGSRGLGLMLARRLAADGARLALVARDAAELARAAQELAGTGATVRIYPADLTNPAARATLVRQVELDLGPIDVLIHNAGVIQVSPLENLNGDDYTRAMQIHFEAPLHLMRLLVPGMRARGVGRVINVASVGGKVAVPHMAAYSASKFALVGLGEAWATELAGTGVRVTTICPGLLRTGSARQAQVKGRHAEEYRWFKLAASLPLLTMSAEDAADDILAAGRRGTPVAVLGWSAQLLSALHGLAPTTTVRLLGAVNQLLPAASPDGEASPVKRGAEVESAVTPNPLTALTDRAAARLNEVG